MILSLCILTNPDDEALLQLQAYSLFPSVSQGGLRVGKIELTQGVYDGRSLMPVLHLRLDGAGTLSWKQKQFLAKHRSLVQIETLPEPPREEPPELVKNWML